MAGSADVDHGVGVVVEYTIPKSIQNLVELKASPARRERCQEDIGFHVFRHESGLVFVLEVKVVFVDDMKVLHLLGPVRQQGVKFVQLGVVDVLAHALIQTLTEFAPETVNIKKTDRK